MVRQPSPNEELLLDDEIIATPPRANPSKLSISTHSALDHLLMGEPDYVKAKVLEVLMQYNLDSDDPAFILMAATGRLQALLEEKPKDLNALFEQWRDETYRQVANYREGLKEYERTALEAQKTAIAQTVQALIRKTAINQFMHQLSAASTIVAAVILTVAAGVGGGAGWMYAQWQRSQVEADPSGKRQLTLEEANTLKWAMSREGQFAKNLMTWNQAFLTRNWQGRFACEDQAKKLGVVLKVGEQKVKSGFCTLWVRPNQQ
ncbi:DUF6753 family protein [Leptolyngbya sp. AN03gr2]|uniref:DUF6753 family protein n=1 Tax=unclassified Leptolyngbya TaxID=2650499 RepID=UPI003D31A6CD